MDFNSENLEALQIRKVNAKRLASGGWEVKLCAIGKSNRFIEACRWRDTYNEACAAVYEAMKVKLELL